jgi:hypothetical protein
MESNHNCFRCVLCDRPAEYVISGDSLCRNCRDQAEITLRMVGRTKNEEEN